MGTGMGRREHGERSTSVEVCDAYITKVSEEWKNDAQAAQWRQSLKDYGPKADLPLEHVTDAVVLACLRKIWMEKTETATRLRGRIERIWGHAHYEKLVTGENPARMKGHLEHALPKASKIKKVKHHAAMPYAEVPALMAKLRKRTGRSAKALRFTILTAVRTEETTGSDWREFDLDKAKWVIPPERMKGGKEHVVPLGEEALEILKSLPKNKPPFQMSENTVLYLLQKPNKLSFPQYTVHGFRSSFRDWAAEETETENFIVEMALAHVIKDKTEKAYRRGQLIAKRTVLMTAWKLLKCRAQTQAGITSKAAHRAAFSYEATGRVRHFTERRPVGDCRCRV
ncbi:MULTISPECIES: site-specific integrase [unclassified Lysobacter]|uniref:tyrosine-type recombinase/integrase n=1 Tax=unclassified Lysobacter TaxID=2635362 RepID=UPI001BE8708F|nr:MULTISPECIES: site-specific integrase [unclassified Lysobacter]MBT2747148.1 site-specific integrase [Lysobacter sp. ISL-42]MBT2752954.1 site-specific integrase [Lysobacter sp. ISL-50]MBT2778885.1 site-specific integrase [Lysobacter sp. ISL-54]MBT2784221.1 site-specific integrase [Lysobacter sp. ISL-52]